MLREIKLKNFRNYDSAEVEFNSDLVLILGNNASGKTNLIESIYFLSNLSSFRSPDNLLAKREEDYFRINAVYGERQLEAVVQTQPMLKRQFKIDDQKIKRLAWSAFETVLFAPTDLNIFSLGPSLRRKYLNETLSQKHKSYAADLASLEHVLKQRAALLVMMSKGLAQDFQLDFWNHELANLSLRISNARREFIEFIKKEFALTYNNISEFSGEFEITYKGLSAETTTEEFIKLLNEHREAEVRSGTNLIGPHRDDLIINKDGVLNIYNSSRGELRSQILAIKLLQAKYLSTTETKPVILLDDVFSELDDMRRNRLLESLVGHQIFITTTEESHLPKFEKPHQTVRVVDGIISNI